MSGDDDDKKTVVLDLNALKKQKLKQEEELANIAQEIQFGVFKEDPPQEQPDTEATTERTAEDFLKAEESSAPKSVSDKSGFRIVLFDFNSDFFQKSAHLLPKGFDYKIAKTLAELNKFLSFKSFQIIVFNYDVNPKAVNQLTAQVKQKFPFSKTMIMAKAISAEKAKMHAKTSSGANGYYQFPLEAKKIEAEFLRIYSSVKKAV